MDDAAVLDIGGVSLALTHDMIVEGVHFLAHDPAEEVAWKLLAVNLSDLAAKGARPIGVLLGYALGEAGWDRDFARGLGTALAAADPLAARRLPADRRRLRRLPAALEVRRAVRGDVRVLLLL